MLQTYIFVIFKITVLSKIDQQVQLTVLPCIFLILQERIVTDLFVHSRGVLWMETPPVGRHPSRHTLLGY